MTPKDVHQFNRRQVLEFLYREKVVSRAELADHLQLSISAVSNMVDELIDDGLIEVESAKSTFPAASRRNERYQISRTKPNTLCVYLSPSLLKVIIVNSGMQPISRLFLAAITPTGPSELIDAIVQLIVRATVSTQKQNYRIALACHGQVDIKTGSSLQMSHAPWKEVIEIKYLLQQRLGFRVVIDNDCVMIALAEKWLNEHQQDFAVINLDYGIGASFLIGGEIYRGQHFSSGQIGHSIVTPEGPLCGCGRRGCLETQASIAAIEQYYQSITQQPLHFATIVERYLADDPQACDVVNRAAQMVGLSLYNFVVTLDINHMILYGASCQFGKRWLQVIIEKTTGNPFEPDSALHQEQTQIRLGQLNEEQQLTGIGYLWVEQELNEVYPPFGG